MTVRYSRWLVFATLTINSCHPLGRSTHAPAPRAAHKPIPHVAADQTARSVTLPAPSHRPVPSSPVAPAYFQSETGGITIQGVAFDTRSHRLAIADQPNGPASLWSDSQEAGRATNALAAVNGGFFTPNGSPLGRVIAHGKPAGAWNSSSLGGGVWFVETNGTSAIARREAARRIPESGISYLLQAGPMLVENGHPVSGLDPTKSSPRTFIAWDGGTRWIIAHADPCTLAGLSSALAANRLVGMPLNTALNLDGGRSAELWVSPSLSGGPVFLRPFWNKPVRNFVLLLPR